MPALTEVQARLFGFTQQVHPEAWLFANFDFAATERHLLDELAKRALNETREQLRVLSLALKD
jgi:hypothetical protein